MKKMSRDARQTISVVRRTRPTVSGRKATRESGVKINTIVFIEFVTLSLCLKSCAWRRRRVMVESTHWQSQFWSSMVSVGPI